MCTQLDIFWDMPAWYAKARKIITTYYITTYGNLLCFGMVSALYIYQKERKNKMNEKLEQALNTLQIWLEDGAGYSWENLDALLCNLGDEYNLDSHELEEIERML